MHILVTKYIAYVRMYVFSLRDAPFTKKKKKIEIIYFQLISVMEKKIIFRKLANKKIIF